MRGQLIGFASIQFFEMHKVGKLLLNADVRDSTKKTASIECRDGELSHLFLFDDLLSK